MDPDHDPESRPEKERKEKKRKPKEKINQFYESGGGRRSVAKLVLDICVLLCARTGEPESRGRPETGGTDECEEDARRRRETPIRCSTFPSSFSSPFLLLRMRRLGGRDS